MKRYAKSMLGVTLLEIMLVLAIAAMVIVMSIRYYQSATTSQQANAALAQVQAISAAMDNLAVGSGSYTGFTSADITALAGTNTMTSVVGASITMTVVSASSYSISMPLSVASCTSVKSRLVSNTKITSPACSAAGVLTYTYDNTK